MALERVHHYSRSEDSVTQVANRCPASVVEKKVVGHTEVVQLGVDKELEFHAKVDSGAEGSSLHAQDIKPFNKNGKLYVKFKTQNQNGDEIELVRPVSRMAKIKSASGSSIRYYFKEMIWIENKSYLTEINLADRQGLTMKFLIGKNLLRHGFLIDTAQSFLVTSFQTKK